MAPIMFGTPNVCSTSRPSLRHCPSVVVVAHNLIALRYFRSNPLQTLRRRMLPVAAATSPKTFDPETLALIEESTKHIEDMVSDILTASSTEKITALVTGEAQDFSESQIVRDAVSRRMEVLNDMFMTTMMTYLQQVTAVGDATIAAVVLAIREQVLEQLSTRMPPEPRILDRLLAMDNSEVRVATLELAAAGGGVQIPPCSTPSLINACNQFIEELEDFEEVPDMQMLARLVIIREEACNVDMQARMIQGTHEVAVNPLLASQAVPVTEIAFLKQLMPLSVGDARCGYIEKAFREGWTGGAVSNAGPSSGDGPANEGDGKPGRAKLRPGRFLLTLSAAQTEMLEQGEQVAPQTLERVEAIRRDVLQVLRRISFEPAS